VRAAPPGGPAASAHAADGLVVSSQHTRTPRVDSHECPELGVKSLVLAQVELIGAVFLDQRQLGGARAGPKEMQASQLGAMIMRCGRLLTTGAGKQPKAGGWGAYCTGFAPATWGSPATNPVSYHDPACGGSLGQFPVHQVIASGLEAMDRFMRIRDFLRCQSD
jgi:hypothetical protein